MDIVLFVIKCILSESGRTSDTAAATVIVAGAARLAFLLLFLSLTVAVFDILLLVRFLFGNGKRFLLAYLYVPDVPVLLNVPLCLHLDGLREIEHFFGLKAFGIVSGIPLLVSVSVNEASQEKLSWLQIEEIGTSVLIGTKLPYRLVATAKQLNDQGCVFGRNDMNKESAVFIKITPTEFLLDGLVHIA